MIDIAVGVTCGGMNDPDVISVIGKQQDGTLSVIEERVHPHISIDSLAKELDGILRSYSPAPLLAIPINGGGEDLLWIMRKLFKWERFFVTRRYEAGKGVQASGLLFNELMLPILMLPILKEWLARATQSGLLSGPRTLVEHWEAPAMAGFALTRYMPGGSNAAL